MTEPKSAFSPYVTQHHSTAVRSHRARTAVAYMGNIGARHLFCKNELVLLLERAGFTDVLVHGDHREEAPTKDSDFVVLVASKPR